MQNRVASEFDRDIDRDNDSDIDMDAIYWAAIRRPLENYLQERKPENRVISSEMCELL